jgi:hypothetical protein
MWSHGQMHVGRHEYTFHCKAGILHVGILGFCF